MDEVLTREERERVERTRKCVSLSPCGKVTDLLTIIDRLTAELAASKRHGDTVSELCEKLEKALTSTADENARLAAELAKARSVEGVCEAFEELARSRDIVHLWLGENDVEMERSDGLSDGLSPSAGEVPTLAVAFAKLEGR